jgi:aerotaxis receptor
MVSTTDLKGRILYGNPTFISASGYSKEELLGQPHNLIRHPDMPEEAFRDLWETVQNGRPWSGVVKNRRKDGRYYWVLANVTPLLQDGQPIGYMSVRTQPSRAQVQGAEALYATMRDEATAGTLRHRLKQGEVLMDTAAGRIARWVDLGATSRIGLLVGALSGASALAMLAASGAWSLLGLGVAAGSAVTAALLGGWLIDHFTLGPVRHIEMTANRMAAGDLTQVIEANARGAVKGLQVALAQLNVNLRSIVRDARTQVDQMRDATSEIASGNQDLSTRTESQAATVEQTASSMEEITATVRNSAQAASQAAHLAAQASDVTQRGSDAMQAVTQTMQVINDSSHRITDIIGVIDGIAFQTNILALNAAVEAARAGEQGRGFAVVAAEVRNLAQRSDNGRARDQATDRRIQQQGRSRQSSDGQRPGHDGRCTGDGTPGEAGH